MVNKKKTLKFREWGQENSDYYSIVYLHQLGNKELYQVELMCIDHYAHFQSSYLVNLAEAKVKFKEACEEEGKRYLEQKD